MGCPVGLYGTLLSVLPKHATPREGTLLLSPAPLAVPMHVSYCMCVAVSISYSLHEGF